MRILVISTLICFAYAETAIGIQVNIDPWAYTAAWTLDDGQDQRGVVSFDLTAGSHFIRISSADSIFLNVAVDGIVTVENGDAATGGVGTLTFNTTSLRVNPCPLADTGGLGEENETAKA